MIKKHVNNFCRWSTKPQNYQNELKPYVLLRLIMATLLIISLNYRNKYLATKTQKMVESNL